MTTDVVSFSGESMSTWFAVTLSPIISCVPIDLNWSQPFQLAVSTESPVLRSRVAQEIENHAMPIGRYNIMFFSSLHPIWTPDIPIKVKIKIPLVVAMAARARFWKFVAISRASLFNCFAP